ncbi:hypothetical protein K1T71_001007, partial [Dendrolimus kikuchii]
VKVEHTARGLHFANIVRARATSRRHVSANTLQRRPYPPQPLLEPLTILSRSNHPWS